MPFKFLIELFAIKLSGYSQKPNLFYFPFSILGLFNKNLYVF
jgi:hypothetical protein